MAAGWLERGERSYEAGRFREACDALERGLDELGPPSARHARFFRLLADSHREMAQYGSAHDAYDRGLKLTGQHDVERVRLLRTCGSILIDDGKYEAAEAALSDALALTPENAALERALLARTLGEVRGAQARYAESDLLYTQAVHALQQVLPRNHPDVAEALNNWGIGAMRLGRLQEAEDRLRASLEIRQSCMAADHPDIGLAFHNLSTLMLRRGRLDEAETLAREALGLWERALGPRHPRLATVLNNLGGIATKRSSYAEAEALYRRGLEIREEILGPNHPRLIHSINNVASAAHHLGRLEEAEMMFRRSLALAQSVLGPGHPEVARALNNLQSVLSDMDRDEEGEALLLRAIRIWEQTLGPDAAELATSLSNLSVCQMARGDVEAAEASLLRALAIEEKRLGKDHPDLSVALNNLGNLYLNAGRVEVAEALYGRALDLRIQAGYHPLVNTLLNLADIAQTRGQIALERDRLQQAIQVLERSKGPDSHQIPPCLRRLSHALRRLGEREAAVDVLRCALAIHERTAARQPTEVVQTLTALGGALRQNGRIEDAEEAYRAGIALLEQDPSTPGGPLAKLLLLLGSILTQSGRGAEALEALGRAQIIVAGTLGADHPLFAHALLWRGIASLRTGEYAVAEELLLSVLARDHELGDGSRCTLALHSLRRLYQVQGRLDDLTRVLEDLIRRHESTGAEDSQFAGLLHELAGLRMAAEQHAEASVLFERVLASTPDAALEFRALVAFYLAHCRWHLGDMDDARERYNQAAAYLRSSEDKAGLLNCLATQMDFLVRIDHLDTALALTEELKTLAESETVPPDAAASGYHALANLFSVCQRWNEAEAAFHAALTCWQRVKTDEGRAGAVSTHCQLARLHYARGQFAEAESSYLTLIQALEEEGPTAKRWLANVLADYAFLLEQTERPSAAAEMRKRAESLAQPRQQD